MIESRPGNQIRRRRYKCDVGHRFTTAELVVLRDPKIVRIDTVGHVRVTTPARWLESRREQLMSSVREIMG